ncbi:pentapeptide repeat-containing protein [Virgibacillus sp. AGTR]|uniref:Pentapeptide repeat-containing protein n=1 Tax=Virgibacillus salarius TaxID=447199 RepID=A0A941DVJ5_9BACI|nr:MULTISPECIES: pentapeptide repeat-containing protein [Virgibacillus]MBR7796137.1 pentapeptide repeat-containing protein [Virgibacillus salarius]MCC2251727.1 pentapeptide repeat-containing protein [Virgibacillus sp. AGTR]NAZ08846.1 pentapeptide repeat-containing protein [Agaribacter marinus]QRZ17100.1 pentapeptide repeat-containing protein [Virgibacillus sp. AGTR]
MSKINVNTYQDKIKNNLKSDCENCFGLCCVALPFAKSADFARNKNAGTPCSNLHSNFNCAIHKTLRNEGFRGCSVFECFGAGQKVSQHTFSGIDWNSSEVLASQMFTVFPIMQQLQEMLWYLSQAIDIEPSLPFKSDLITMFTETEQLTFYEANEILTIDIQAHRDKVNDLLQQTSAIIRSNAQRNFGIAQKKDKQRADFIRANFYKADLRGENLRGALFIAADLREADLRGSDLIGADLRDANIQGTNLSESLFITQPQLNAANGDASTKIPSFLHRPSHWEYEIDR